MDPANRDKKVDTVDLQKEVLEMRQQIPIAYRNALEKDFEMFKERLTNIIAQRTVTTSQLLGADIQIDSSLFNTTVYPGEEEMRRYIENAERLVKNLKRDDGKKKKKDFY